MKAPIFVAFSAAVLTGAAVAQDSGSSYGCFSSIPSGFTDMGEYQYQSYSYCAGQCASAGLPVYVLYNGKDCLCGSSLPSTSDKTDSSSCSVVCAGFGQDTCGGTDAYQVFYTGSLSSLTAAASSSASATATASSSKESSASSAKSSDTSTSPTSTSSSSSPASSDSSSDSSSSTGTSQSSSTGTSTANQATSSASSASSHATASASPTGEAHKKSSSVSGGAIAGIVIGVLVALAIIGAVIVFLKRRRDSNKYESYSPNLGPHGFKEFESPGDSGIYPPPPMPTKKPFVDPRLNPSMLGERRLSEGSLADARDYSRKILRVANPDNN